MSEGQHWERHQKGGVQGTGRGALICLQSPKNVRFPSECLNHGAERLVSKSCDSKHQCVVAVSNRTFQDPCAPGTRKYLSVAYSCGKTRSALASGLFQPDLIAPTAQRGE